MDVLTECIREIEPLDSEAMRMARLQSDSLTKPPGSLGKLEKLAEQLAGITGSPVLQLPKKAIIVMAGDHGVCDEGVSAFPQEVTPQMVMNFLGGGAAVNVLARHVGADIVCVDMGVKTDIEHERLLVRKIRRGTNNIARGPAMSREEAIRAVEAGIEVASGLVAQGYGLLATGEMGIGNTTPSAAMLAVLGGISVADITGRGTGIDDAGLARKRAVIECANEINWPDSHDPLDVLSKLGGFEIAGLAGLVLGAAANRCPIVIDGFIATVAALVAYRLAPAAREYMIPSHLSDEAGHRAALEQLGLEPMLHLDMRLGEGTGAALAMSMIDASIKLMNEMATFDSAGVSTS